MSWKKKTTGLTVLFPASLSAGLAGGRVEMLSRPCWQTHPWNWNLSACDNLCDSKFRAASHSRSCWRLVFKLSRRKQGFLRWAWKSLNNLCRMDFAASLHLSQSQRLFWRSSSRWGEGLLWLTTPALGFRPLRGTSFAHQHRIADPQLGWMVLDGHRLFHWEQPRSWTCFWIQTPWLTHFCTSQT